MLPAIRRKLPHAATVKVQFDNAPGHKTTASSEDKLIANRLASALAAPMKDGRRTGPRIEIVPQCPNSPDTNACDLGFFKSLDSRLPKRRSFKLDAFEKQIIHVFNHYPPEKLDAIFDQKKRVCKAIIEAGGDNDYKMPHTRDIA